MVPWWERWCGYQARTVGLPLLRYACYARLGHQTLLWIKEFFSKISYNYLNAYIFNFFFSLLLFASPGLSLQFSSPCF